MLHLSPSSMFTSYRVRHHRRGSFSEMEKVTRVLAVTALDVCRRQPAELR
jgi:hypothetical protein